MKYFFLTFIVGLSIVSFSKKPPKLPKPKAGEWIETTKPSAPKNIYGIWTWLETDCCGARHGISTPNSTANNIELDIRNDNTFFETHTKKNALPRNGNLLLFKENNFDMVQFNDERPARFTLSSNSDTLTISWKYLELQTEKYIRKK